MNLNDKILKRLKRAKPDQVFTRSDFFDLGSTHAIGMVIQRLVKAVKLRRVARGLYDLPRRYPLLGELFAASDAIAAAIARRDGIRLQTQERLAHLRKLLKPADRSRLLRDLRFAPAWMHSYLRFIAGEEKPA